MRSCDRPRNRSASEALPSSVSNLYCLSIRTQGSSCRRSDELARRRQELPWVRIDKQYEFETDEGSASLAGLFRWRSQLLIHPPIFDVYYEAGGPVPSA